MSGSFESVRWNACVHRLDLGLYSHPKELFLFVGFFGVFLGGGGGVESKTMLTPWGKPPLPEAQEGRTRDAASRRTASPTHYRNSFKTNETKEISVGRLVTIRT